jgi:hypothetical protein
MSIYNNNIKTHLIDPVYSRNNYRAEFRLQPGTAYMSSLRLTNLGLFGAADKAYNGYLGTYGVIRQISLLDGDTVLDQVLQYPIWQAFKNYNRTNKENMDLKSRLAGTRAGNYVLENANSTSQIKEWQVNAPVTKALESAASKGWLDLIEVFPLLRKLEFVDTRFFKNMKLVIEFNTDVNQMLVDSTATTLQTCQLMLIADEVLSNVPQFKGVQFVGIEHDRVTLPAIVAPTTIATGNKSAVVSKSFLVNGFNNKTLGRCLISKQSNLPAVYQTGGNNFRVGKVASVANNHEVLQMTIDGSELIRGKGLQYENQRLAMLHDVWGTCSTYPFANGQAWKVDNEAAQARSIKIQGAETQIGLLDFYGLNINSSVLDMQIDFDRTGVWAISDVFSNAMPENAEQEMNIFCEVYKQIAPNGQGGYSVSYV